MRPLLERSDGMLLGEKRKHNQYLIEITRHPSTSTEVISRLVLIGVREAS